MRRIFVIAFVIPLIVVLAAFAVANRAATTVSFDPFDSVHPALAITMPQFILIFVLVGLGVLVGGIAAWLRQHKWRMRARRAEAEVRDLRARLDAGVPRPSVPATVEASPFVVPPTQAN